MTYPRYGKQRCAFIAFMMSFSICVCAFASEEVSEKTPPSQALYFEKVPCVKKKGTRWQISKEDCLQLTHEHSTNLAKIQVELKRLRGENAVLREQVSKYKQRDGVWMEREALWKDRLRLTEESAKKAEERVLLWRSKFEQQRTATQVWYTHPIFVAAVTAIVTIGVVYVVGNLPPTKSTVVP